MAYDIFTLGTQRDWPRRLLHIPTMTSLERQPGNYYGADKEPLYGILSYTWGRYEVSDGPSLHVEGVDWKIPSINPDHFAVADLERLLQEIGRKDDYVWIDIACIDQKREKVKMEEVGRQASIFKTAKRAYVWLNKHDPDVIQQYMQNLLGCAYEYAQGNMGPRQAAKEIIESLSNVLADPWFSSLWTLQESVLQRHAILLNKRGEPITTSGPWTGESPAVQLMDISGTCVMARAAIDRAMEAEESTEPQETVGFRARVQMPLQNELLNMRTIIDKSGIDFGFCPNPNIQYSAARFRQTSRPEDRIYAIMQVYGYRLGSSNTSIRKPRKFSLAELELQFLRTMTGQSALLSQTFRHLTPPERGQTWCIINHVEVPKRFHWIVVHEQFSNSSCLIFTHRKDKAYFDGWACSLNALHQFWQARTREVLEAVEDADDAPKDTIPLRGYLNNTSSRDAYLRQAKQGFVMDYGNDIHAETLSFEWPPDSSTFDDGADLIIESRISELTQSADKQEQLFDTLLSKYGESRVQILYLGRVKNVNLMEVGLILVHEENTLKGIMMKQKVWRRIGVCFWLIKGGHSDDFTKTLRPLKGRFG